jgi:hypothetical protein
MPLKIFMGFLSLAARPKGLEDLSAASGYGRVGAPKKAMAVEHAHI